MNQTPKGNVVNTCNYRVRLTVHMHYLSPILLFFCLLFCFLFRRRYLGPIYLTQYKQCL